MYLVSKYSEGRVNAGDGFAAMTGLVAPNLKYCVVSPTPVATIRVPSVDDPPNFVVRCIERAENNYGLKGLGSQSRKAFISTGSANAVQAALTKLEKATLTHHVPANVQAHGLRDMVKSLRLDQVDKISPPTFSPTKIMNMEFSKTKKSGFTNIPKEHTLFGTTDPTGTKDETFMHTALYLIQSLEELRHAAASPDHFISIRNVLARISDPIAKLSLKPELRVEGDDPEKVRIFFLVSFFHYMVAKITTEPIHDYLLNLEMCSIGFRWLGGGCKKLYDYLGGGEKRRFFCADIARKDTNFKAPDLAILLSLIRSIYAPGDSIEHRILYALFDWLIQNTAYHVVNWPGGFRFVIGLLFSGDYNTSILNTLHVIWAMHCYVVERGVYGAKYRQSIRSGAFRFRVQGDDVIGSFSEDISDHMNPEDLAAYMTTWEMSFKPEAFRVSDRLESEVDWSRGTLTTPICQSIVFLKRYFVLADGHVRPFRPVKDTTQRLLYSTTPMSSETIYASRVLGLALDTMGVNPIAYRVAITVYRSLLELTTNPELDKNVRSNLATENFMRERIYKAGLGRENKDDVYAMIISRSALLRRLDGDSPTFEEEMLWVWEREMPINKY